MIAHGHALADIRGYTWRQIELFFREACRRERLARADRMEDAASAWSKDLPKIVKKLRGKQRGRQ